MERPVFPQVWLVDLAADADETYRSLAGHNYSDVEILQAEGQLTSLAFQLREWKLGPC